MAEDFLSGKTLLGIEHEDIILDSPPAKQSRYSSEHRA